MPPGWAGDVLPAHPGTTPLDRPAAGLGYLAAFAVSISFCGVTAPT